MANLELARDSNTPSVNPWFERILRISKKGLVSLPLFLLCESVRRGGAGLMNRKGRHGASL